MDHKVVTCATSASASSTIVTTSIPILTVRLGDKGTKESLYWNFVFRGGHRRFGMPSVLYHQMYSQQGLCLDLRSTSWRNLSSTGTFRDVCQ